MRTTQRFLAWLGFVVALLACGSDPPANAVGEASAAPTGVASPQGVATSPSADASAVASVTAVSPVIPAPPAPTVTATPVLFEVKKGNAVGYLFGTMHTGVDAHKELNPIVFKKLDEAKVVVLEADVFNVNPMEIAKVAMFPPGTEGVAKKLKPGHWKIVVDRLSSFLMPESSLAQMKPWFIGTMLVQKMLPEVEPIDSVIYHRADRAGKQLVYVETVKEQLDMVEKSFEVKVLDDMLADMPKTERLTLELADAYRKGDLDALTKMFEMMFFARNNAWVPKLMPLFDKGGVFVAVGAGHLLGDKGVGALLAKQGYSVERIKL